MSLKDVNFLCKPPELNNNKVFTLQRNYNKVKHETDVNNNHLVSFLPEI